ncbi:hypothetical protein SAMN04489761_4326 [Tenacibaculum sp. MAR_2009_124]|uniref:hypothetical protein n=1 Tax=Tenacibaculum sp. MAR_2009_124 TaxID=1250059 RepID=UPI00089673BB|nr:hypothetical protein [Tenacibaculum sp. MAR_2009_124]SED11765.1 hypothetical protein SAMN04489761_4326 [Tenacibaculum sp. MAR_2009_124]
MPTRYKTETLLKRLERYDEKYKEQITSHNDINFGYGMRSYHRLKVWNPPYEKTKEKAEKVKAELTNRGVQFYTRFV